MTTTKITGADWNEMTLRDITIGYPNADPVAEFNKIAAANGSTAQWIPKLSSVIADIDEIISDDTLRDWYEQAIEQAYKRKT